MVSHQVAGMTGAWEGQLVVTPAPLAPELVAALLAAGARAVVSRRAGTPSPSSADAVAFFAALYDQLLGGRTILQVRAATAGRSGMDMF